MKSFFNWSGGKDSALALYTCLKLEMYQIDHLVTTYIEQTGRVSMHGVSLGLMQKQADAIGLPLRTIGIPGSSDMEAYNRAMNKLFIELKNDEFEYSIFGDIFLEDLRDYREQQLQPTGIKALFPLWKMDTALLAREFVDLGFKAVVVCTDGKHLGDEFVGRELDYAFLDDLPGNVDPCGENGEFHSFVYDGPIFSAPVKFNRGKKIHKFYQTENLDDSYGFWYIDLIA